MGVTLDIPHKPSLRPDETAHLLGCSEFHMRRMAKFGVFMVDIRSAYVRKPAIRIINVNEIPNDPVIKTSKTAKILKCTPEHVRHGIEEGSLAAIDIKSPTATKPAFRVITQSVKEFIERRKTV